MAMHTQVPSQGAKASHNAISKPMTERLVYTLTVPSVPESLPVLEGLCETFITENERFSRDIALILRLSVTEACQNALKLACPPGRLKVVTLNFLRSDVKEAREIALEIKDSGTGLPIEGHAPPYPKYLVGKECVISDLLDQKVIAKVHNHLNVTLTSEELSESAGSQTRRALTGETRPRGFGLLALCRCWQKVHFSYNQSVGSTLRLEQPMRNF